MLFNMLIAYFKASWVNGVITTVTITSAVGVGVMTTNVGGSRDFLFNQFDQIVAVNESQSSQSNTNSNRSANNSSAFDNSFNNGNNVPNFYGY